MNVSADLQQAIIGLSHKTHQWNVLINSLIENRQKLLESLATAKDIDNIKFIQGQILLLGKQIEVFSNPKGITQ